MGLDDTGSVIDCSITLFIEWRDRGEIENDEKVKEYLSRKHRLKIELESRNMLMVGPRQVGKTTSLKLKIFDLIKTGVNPKNIFFFSCELISKKGEIIEALQEFERLAEGKKYVFLDEITFVKDWQNAVKFLLDSPLSGSIFYFRFNAPLPP